MSNHFDILPCDLSNPGHFFACCGLMEIATLIDRDVVGCFKPVGFWMSVPVSEVLRELIVARLTPVPLAEGSRRARGGQPHKIAPLHIRVNDRVLIVDWWLDDDVADFKTWSGGQSASGAALAMHAALVEMGAMADVLDRAVPTSQQPYYYDCRAGGNAIDLGFMDSNLITVVYAATELLAFIGLQRFRPFRGETRWNRRYACWSQPLPIELATATAAGMLPPLEQHRWHFEMTWRDASGRYKAFGRAHLQAPLIHTRSREDDQVAAEQV